ncbi:hypothetical protein B0H13DRAFT_2371005 [Mycena leptocephala]|nr:hypothetical protein B0H13DRAFT_2371005 [Mycena leptocephala]
MVFNARMFSRLAVLAAIAASCSAQNTIGCFGGGSTVNCTAFIPIFCASLGIKSIAPSDVASRCFTAPNGLRCDFDVVNQSGTTDIPSPGNCQTLLTQVAATCPQGGSGQIVGSAFEFFVDPNVGACGVAL